MIYLGIDPDVKESGFAVVKNRVLINHGILGFFEIIGLIDNLKHDAKYGSLTVVIEAGWLNAKSNWHPSANARTAQRIAKNVGANHQIGKLFEEYCRLNKVNYYLNRPRTSKVNKKWLANDLGIKIKNQDEADAIMQVYGFIN